MTVPHPPSQPSHFGATPTASPHSLFGHHDAPPAGAESDPLIVLRGQLAELRADANTPEQHAAALDLIYAHSMTAVDALLGSLDACALVIPIAKTTRLRIRNAQQLLRALCEDYQTCLDALPIAQQHERAGAMLWRAQHALAQHLLISSLVAAPATLGVWRQLHQLFAAARFLRVTDYAAENARATIQDTYFAAVLLSCAQPAAFTAPEIAFIAAYLERHANAVEVADESAEHHPATFWIDPARDTTAFACARKTAPPQTPVQYFSCAKLAMRLTRQLGELERGIKAVQLDLPELADAPVGRSILRRLAAYWGEPSKRRYPRRRQNYRAQLCSGLGRLWRLFRNGEAAAGEASNWMITNESPDGYALMHVSGKTGGLSVGDITALHCETAKTWQVCIVRWALSENQEHLELGLQILATQAYAARLALPSNDGNPALLSVLILPALGALRSDEMLVIPASAQGRLPDKQVLVIEKENIELREVKCLRLAESNSKIAVFAIAPDPRPA